MTYSVPVNSVDFWYNREKYIIVIFNNLIIEAIKNSAFLSGGA